MSASVKAYFALKMIGETTTRRTWRGRARRSVRAEARPAPTSSPAAAGAVRLHSVARVPVMPVEIMLLPKWFPFHLDKISYWSRTVIVPLLVLMALKPRARNPQGRRASTSCFSIRRNVGPRRRRRSRRPRGSGSSAASTCAACGRAAISRRAAPARHRPRRGLGDRAAQRRGRARRDLSGDGQQRDDVRRARLPGGPSACGRWRGARSRSCSWCMRTRPIASPASRRSGTPGLPPCAAGGRRRARGGAGAGLEWLEPHAGARREGRLGGAAAGRASRRLGVPVRQSALSRRRRHRGGRDGDGPRAGPAGASTIPRRRSRARGNGSSACRARTAAGARSMPTTNTTISTTSRSPTMARCSIRRPRT